jgi:hypothetical protein
MRSALLDAKRREDQQAENPKNARQRISGQTEELKSKQREVSRLKNELRAAKEERASGPERLKRIKSKKSEVFQLENELSGAKTGALPDFVIIGAQKCGTTSFYHLLVQHPYVEPAATKELHFFDSLFEEGVDLYRRCFPPPVWKDGRRTITGEATLGYLFRPYIPERMAEVIPQARLIALLRNPVDRAYSQYHQRLRKGGEHRTFEEVIIEAANKSHAQYLSRGIYVDQLLRWSKFFSDEQMLVLKSEDFFEHPQETLKIVLDFLDLPHWEPEALEIRKKGYYERKMDAATRQWLEEYFEPHNRRLYEYLGVDFGW